MDLFYSQSEMRRLAHRHEGVWIAPTRSTFNSYLPDIYPELPYLIHQNSPLAWSILTFIHRNQDQSPLQRSSTNLHRQKNTLYLESLRYAVILHAKKILTTIENNCMKCLRRKQEFLTQSIGQPLPATYEKIVRPFKYVQMDLTGRHITEGGQEIYGLVVICVQTYNVRIYGVQNRKLESISLALEVLIQEFGPPTLISCDREGSFCRLAENLKPKEMETLEATHNIQVKFSVANGHFTTGLVERRMKSVHDYIGKMEMQGSGFSTTDVSLMFQYVAFKLNSVPYGVRNINSYSEKKIQELRGKTELISFIRPADWLLFSAPKGIDFTTIKNTLRPPIKSAIDKIMALQDFRNEELMEEINKQYKNVNLQASNKLKENSIVLLRHMNKEQKREPLRLARVDKIHDSRDGSQRIVGVTYQNVRRNKDGQWIGMATKVERCVKDIILVDSALNDATLHPVAEANTEINTDTTLELDEDPMTEANTEVDTDVDPTVELETKTEISIHDPNLGEVTMENIAELTGDTDKPKEMRPESEVPKHANTDTGNAETNETAIDRQQTNYSNNKSEPQNLVRRSKRIMNKPNPVIPSEDIGDNDNPKDIDYA